MKNPKAEKFEAFLKENNITIFEVEEINDASNTVVFRSRMEVENQLLPTVLIVDDSIYTLLRVQIVNKLVKEDNKEAVWHKINELNQEYKIFKYYITNDGDIIVDCCIPSDVEFFDGNIIRAIIDVTLQHLIGNYSKLMRTVWAEPPAVSEEIRPVVVQ